MEQRQLGRSGLTVSSLGLGCNNFGWHIEADASTAVVNQAIESGITFFDTAEMYGATKSEQFLGAALAGHRHEVVIATKFGAPTFTPQGLAPGSRANVIRACEGSLRRLNTDYIDLYYQHYPDPRTPVEETLGALSDLVHQGKVRYAGCSNYSAWQLAEAHHQAANRNLEPFVANQVEWNLIKRAVEAEVVPASRKYGAGVVPFFPLASGLLTGKYRRGEAPPEGVRLGQVPAGKGPLSDKNFDLVDRLTDVAESSGHTILELAVCWLLAQDGVSSVIAGATSPEQIKSNVASAEWVLSADELAAVDEALAVK